MSLRMPPHVQPHTQRTHTIHTHTQLQVDLLINNAGLALGVSTVESQDTEVRATKKCVPHTSAGCADVGDCMGEKLQSA